ncbi:hypothetical protein LXL04_013727 [Taraxacum kok-saghyz]
MKEKKKAETVEQIEANKIRERRNEPSSQRSMTNKNEEAATSASPYKMELVPAIWFMADCLGMAIDDRRRDNGVVIDEVGDSRVVLPRLIFLLYTKMYTHHMVDVMPSYLKYIDLGFEVRNSTGTHAINKLC